MTLFEHVLFRKHQIHLRNIANCYKVNRLGLGYP